MIIKSLVNDRKQIIKALEDMLETKAVYAGPPTFNYTVGDFIVQRDGDIFTTDDEAGQKIQGELASKGLTEDYEGVAEISFSMEGMAAATLTNLVFLLFSKQYLLNKALGGEHFKINERFVESLNADPVDTVTDFLQRLEENGGNDSNAGIRFDIDKLAYEFPFREDYIKSFTQLAAKIVEQAKNQHRVNLKKTIEENEKFAMRVWLVRIGMDGNEYKTARKQLTANLKGNAAFKTEAQAREFSEKQKQIRKASKKVGE